MKMKAIWALLWVNVVLLVGVALRMTAPASAQRAGPHNYVMIPGEIVGGNSTAVYIIDTDLGRLGFIRYDDPTGTVQAIRPLDINTLFQNQAAGRR